MSFLYTTFPVPLWFLIFAFACATPLWIKWYKVFQKATNNQNVSGEHNLKTADIKKSKREHDASSSEQPYIKIVLKTLALTGDAGMLIQSIADKLEIKSNEIKISLTYLKENKFVESVMTGSGEKHYLTSRGKKYCIKRGYIAE